jgi:hypothetical protein
MSRREVKQYMAVDRQLIPKEDRLTEVQLVVLGLLIDYPRVTAAMVVEQARCSESSALQTLQEVVALGFAMALPEGRFTKTEENYALTQKFGCGNG